MKTRALKTKKGFTLIETLVAIAIFAFSITGLISITATGVFDTNFVKNKFTASYLAMEGVELVRNIRDTAAVSGQSWGVIINDPTLLEQCFDDKVCMIDPDPQPDFDSPIIPAECPGAICPALSYRKSEASFNYDLPDNVDNLQSIFVRTINMQLISPFEARVIPRVEWNQGSELRHVEFSFNLLDWPSP